jgi:hypothetical protein
MTASNEPNLGQIHLSTFNKLRFDFFILGILYEQMKVSNTYSGTGQVVVKDAAFILVSEKWKKYKCLSQDVCISLIFDGTYISVD